MRIILAINGFFDRLYRRPLGRLLFSLVMVGGVFLFAIWRVEPAYLMNDDTNISFALAGYRTGAPFAAHPFINILLGFCVSGLYGLFPAVPWWFVCQEAAMLVSAVVLSLCVLRTAQKRNVHWLIACMLCGVLMVGLLFRPFVRVTFTLTAAALGTAAVALLLSFDRTDPRPVRTAFAAASGVLLIAAFCFRNSSGISLACFYFAALLYRFLDAHFFGKAERKRLKRRTGAFALIMALLVALTVGVNRRAIEVNNAEGYLAFDEARANFVDYRLCDTYHENPALYASVGWDETLHDLARNWCFMDARVTTEALEALAASSARANESVTERAAAIPARIETFLSGDYFARLMLVLPPCALAAAIAILALARRRDPLAFVFAVCMLLGGAVLICYLAFCDRLILRTFRLVLMPASFAVALLALRILPVAAESAANGEPTGKGTGFSWRGACCYALCTLLLLFGGLMSGRALADTLRSDYTDEIALCRTLIDYCMAHPDVIFIRDTATCSNLDATSTYPDEKPTNLIAWGDTDMLTGVQRAQLALLGLDAFDMDVFRQENVRYLGTIDGGAYAAFRAYLQANGGMSLELVDMAADGVGVFRVVSGAPGA